MTSPLLETSLGPWLLIYVIESFFWLWMIRGGGAERLEGSFLSSLVDYFALRWSADGIKLFAGLTWVGSTLLFLLGLVNPEWRFSI